MKLTLPRRHSARALVLFVALLALGCSDAGTGVIDELAPLVGSWQAQALVLTNQADPEEVLDLVDLGAVFLLSILATGEYTASLTLFGMANIQLGTITISGNQLTLTPNTPPDLPSTQGTWSLSGGILFIDGTTEFDFGVDGTDEAANVHFELYRLES